MRSIDISALHLHYWCFFISWIPGKKNRQSWEQLPLCVYVSVCVCQREWVREADGAAKDKLPSSSEPCGRQPDWLLISSWGRVSTAECLFFIFIFYFSGMEVVVVWGASSWMASQVVGLNTEPSTVLLDAAASTTVSELTESVSLRPKTFSYLIGTIRVPLFHHQTSWFCSI